MPLRFRLNPSSSLLHRLPLTTLRFMLRCNFMVWPWTSASELSHSQDFIMVSERTYHLHRPFDAFVVYRARHMCDIPHTRGSRNSLKCPKCDVNGRKAKGQGKGAEGKEQIGTEGIDHVSTSLKRESVRGPAYGRGINSLLIAMEGGFKTIHISQLSLSFFFSPPPSPN